MKDRDIFITALFVAVIILSFTVRAEDYTNYDYYYEDTVHYNWGDRIAPHRIPSRWTMTVKVDTIQRIIKESDEQCECPPGSELWPVQMADLHDFTFWCVKVVCVPCTTWTKRVPVYLDSAQYDRLLEWLKPWNWDSCGIIWDVDTTVLRHHADSCETIK